MGCIDRTYAENNECRFPDRSCNECDFEDANRRHVELNGEDVILHYEGGAEVKLPADIESLSYVPRPPKPKRYKKVTISMAGQIHTITHPNKRDGNAIGIVFKGSLYVPSTAINILLLDGEISYEIPS